MKARYGEILTMARFLGDKRGIQKLTHDREKRPFKYNGTEKFNIFCLCADIWEKVEKYNRKLQDLREQYGVNGFQEEIDSHNAEADRLAKVKADKEAEVAKLTAERDQIIEAAKAKHTTGDFQVPRKAKDLDKKIEAIEIPDVPERDTRTLEDHPSIKSFRSDLDKLLSQKTSLECEYVFITEDLFGRVMDDSAQDTWMQFPWFFVVSKAEDVKRRKEELDAD